MYPYRNKSHSVQYIHIDISPDLSMALPQWLRYKHRQLSYKLSELILIFELGWLK